MIGAMTLPTCADLPLMLNTNQTMAKVKKRRDGLYQIHFHDRRAILNSIITIKITRTNTVNRTILAKTMAKSLIK